MARPDWRCVFKIGGEERNWRQANTDNFQRGAKPWAVALRVRSRSFSLIGRNNSEFVHFGERSSKEGKTDDSGKERDP